MMNPNRHQAGSAIAGEKTGGQFKAAARTTPEAPPSTPAPKRKVAVTIPARTVQLDAPESELNWPRAFGEPYAVGFGVDDKGQFFSSFTFDHDDLGPTNITVTEYPEGPDHSSCTVPHHEASWEGTGELVTQVHSMLRTNSNRVGRATSERDPELKQQVIAASLGKSISLHDFDTSAPDRALKRARRALTGWGVTVDGDPESQAVELQDTLTDMLHWANDNDIDMIEVLRSARRMHREEASESGSPSS